MTLSNTVVRVQYNGDGATASFTVTFPFWDADDLTVILTDANGDDTTWVRGTQYTVSGGDGATGTVSVETTPTDYTPASGETLTILSALTLTQDVSLPLGGALPSADVEQRLDKNVRLIQQMDEKLDRAVLLPESSSNTDLTIPDPVSGNFLRWKTDLSGLENTTSDTFSSSSSIISTSGDTARTLADRFDDVFNVKDFGAVGDGTTDDTANIQQAIDAAEVSGGLVFFPAGSYIVSSALTVDSNYVLIFGSGIDATEIKLADSSNDAVINMTAVTGCGVFNLSIDGNRSNQSSGLHGLRADGERLSFENLYIHDTYSYGIGLAQSNGTSLKDVRFTNITIRNAGADGVDIKNKNDNNYGVVFNGIVVDKFDLRGLGGQAGLDIRGEGVTLSNVHIQNTDNVAGNIGIRFREGELLAANGLGGHKSSLINFSILGNETNASVGIAVNCRKVNISNGHIRGVSSGIKIGESLCSIQNVIVENCSTEGFGVQSGGINPAHDCSIIGCRTDSCGEGFDIEDVARLVVQNCVTQNSTTRDIHIQSNAEDTSIVNNSFSSVLDGGTRTHARNNIGWKTEAYLVGSTDHDLTSIGTKSEVISHGLDVTPSVEHCQLSLYYASGNEDARLALMPSITTVDSNNISVKARVDSADSAGTSVGNFLVYINAKP